MRLQSVDPSARHISERATSRPASSAEILVRTCPVCGKELEERKCKLFCPDPRCNYFLSCADYY
jgi:hypothetical protein